MLNTSNRLGNTSNLVQMYVPQLCLLYQYRGSTLLANAMAQTVGVAVLCQR